MSKPVHTKVFIGQHEKFQTVSYSIKATQKMAQHQELELSYSESAKNSNFTQEIVNLVGLPFRLEIWELQERTVAITSKLLLEYQGVVTDVSIIKEDQSQPEVLIFVKSPTELLTHGKDSMSFEKETLVNIIREATKGYPNGLVEVDANPRFTDVIPYTVQYKESDFDFMCRLAKRYGEWFYYDGTMLRFGAPSSKDPVILTIGAGFDVFTFKAKSRAQNYSYLGYDYQAAKVHTSSMKEEYMQSKNPYIDKVMRASKNLYAKEPLGSYNNSSLEGGQKELSNVVKLKTQAAHNMLYVKGESDNEQVTLGGLISIKGKNINDPSKEEVYGTYIITAFSYKISKDKQYENNFEGVPKEIDVPDQYQELRIPLSEEQFAVVTDNNDPKGMGRVRVGFPWQAKNGGKSPWIRLATSHAGAGKGFYFIPEIGEEVLVGFEGGNAENPYVIGTRYNSKQKTPVNDPAQKIIQTRSGNKIVLNDADGSVFISDNGKASIKMDGAGNIEVNAEKMIKFSVCGKKGAYGIVDENGDISFNAENRISLGVNGNGVQIDSEGNVIVTGDNVQIHGKKTTTVHGKTTVDVTGDKVKIN